MKLEYVIPKKLRVEEERSEGEYYYGRYVLSPLEKGYGTTIGNALRRVLLSSIPSIAITGLRFIKPEKYHEFDTLPGVKEDILEIILNLKKVQLRAEITVQDKIRMQVEKKGPGILTAGDIKTPAGIEVVNPSLKIATLDEEADLFFELYAQPGKGFVPAIDLMEENQEIGWITIDGVFSPVVKVNFTVESARVEKRTDYDKLILEIWTKKNIFPNEALKQAVKILMNHLQIISDSLPEEFTAFSGEFVPISQEEAKVEQTTSEEEAIYSRKIEELELSIRSLNCLRRDKIETIGDLLKRTEEDLLKIKNLGPKSLEEIKQKLMEKFGLTLRKGGDSQ
ncbi:DNA-directed RNA polymerase subunit alpha [Pseudothermotoga thermarum]|uniref:DNA-directed RNA polymerase subunit alpha n=1 Tax=Pseudothermotoga thermarum DSM 5069 TaxID=688269 RepID=F7YXZ8_9THEM|nr:DNA-directed RNA polymerase subunit alpha [Pseudothermotoga thermarum]AEH50801.1 DNA-directed RNA polymerase subunit alpha [Pseudothermotoga thermarum DSM 5069]